MLRRVKVSVKISGCRGLEFAAFVPGTGAVLAHLANRKASLELMYRVESLGQEKRSDIRFDYEALLPEADMDRIFRYEERMHRDIDWAMQRLLESQERRKNIGFHTRCSIPAGTN